MELINAAQYIRDTVSMDSILGLYGYQTKHGFMSCPFHSGDHTASLKVYEGGKGWFCYGCHRGGSVLDFVMEHDGCSFFIAVQAIDKALGLNLMEPDSDPFNYERRQLKDAVIDSLEQLLIDMIDDKSKEIDIRLRVMSPKLSELESIPKKDRTADQWTALLSIKDEMQRLDDQENQCDQMREEVRTWRREMRRARKAEKAR